MDNTLNSSSTRVIAYTIGALAMALLLLWTYLQYAETLNHKQVPQNQSRNALMGLPELILNGDVKTAVTAAEATKNSTSDPKVQASARSIEATGRYLSGETVERIKAVELLKQNYVDASATPATKAKLINSILGYISNSREQALFDAVFSGKPFEQFAVEGNLMASVGRLADHSISLYPTSFAVFQSVLPDMASLIDYDKTYELTTKEKEMHADAILTALDKAQALYTQEKTTRQTGFDLRSPATYFYWRGTMLSAAALVHSDRVKDADDAFGSVLSYYDSTRNSKGQKIPYIQILVPYAYMGRANLHSWTDSKKNKTQIISALDSFMKEIRDNENVHKSGVLALIRNLNKDATYSQAYTIGNFKRLAGIYPEFGTFVASYGLDLK